jgi:hypothetical protein
MKEYSCPRCQNRKFYSVRRGKKRCKNCLYEWKPKIAGLRLARGAWKKILFWFILGHSLRTISEQTEISHYSVEKAINIARKTMTKDVPGVFSGTVEVDETYLGGQKKNKRKSQLNQEPESKLVGEQQNNRSLAF